MKKIKIVLLLVVIILMSGCSGVYELTINEDLSVTESASFSLNQNETTYDKALELLKKYDISEEDSSVKSSDNIIKVSFTKKFSSIEDYILNSKIYPNITNNINYSNADRNLSMDTTAIFSTGIKNNDNIVNNYDIGLLKINIQTPLHVKDSNADEVDSGIYTWNIKNGDSKKHIKLDIGTESFSENYKYIIILAVIAIIIISFAVIGLSRYKTARKI